jgi:hypothetical protein
MKVWGEFPKTVTLRIGGHRHPFEFKPVVLEGLAMPHNISGPFLAEHDIDQLHSLKAIRVKGTTVKLLARPQHQHPEDFISTVYTLEDVTLAPFSQQLISTAISSMEANRMPKQQGFINSSNEFQINLDCSGWQQVMVQPNRHGHVLAGMLNTSEEELQIPTGAAYGHFTLSRKWKDKSSPWKIAVLEVDNPTKDQGPTLPPTSWPQSPPVSKALLPGPTTKANHK